jgi:hypothetical protein
MEKLNNLVLHRTHTISYGLQKNKLYNWNAFIAYNDKQLMQTTKIPTGICILALGISKALVLYVYIYRLHLHFLYM